MANPRNITSLASLRESLTGVETFYVVDYQGLNAAGITRLRRALTAQGSRMVVAKNTLVNIALKDAGRDVADLLTGPTAIIIVKDDPAGTAKTLAEFAKGNDKGIPNPRGGMLDGVRIDVKTINKLASLGTKDQLRAEVVGVLSAHLSNFVGMLEAYKEKLESAA